MKLPKINPLNVVQKTIPIAEWLPKYNGEKAITDLVGGITVGLTLIPQSIAYSALAGLSPQIGLYSALTGGIVYAIFGTIPELNIAPTALLSLLTYTYTHGATYGAIPATIFLCFMSGIVELLCGILHLGFLVDFVSTPVVAGFTSAGAIIIASAQVKNVLGLSFEAESFKEIWHNVFTHISETKTWDLVLSACCCVTLLSLRKLKDYGKAPFTTSDDISQQSVQTKMNAGRFSTVKKIVWFLSVSRNATVVVVCSLMAYIFELNGSKPFTLTPKVPSGLPIPAPPQFTVTQGNQTFTFIDMAKELYGGIFVVPFVAILGNVAIAKAFSKGKVVDATQEMVAVGICNIISSFFSSMPINASFSRAAISNASGTKTPFSGLYTGVMVVLALTFLTPYFSYMPKATLSSVIICAVIYMVEITLARMIWKVNNKWRMFKLYWMDFIPFLASFFACLILGMEIGICVGVVADVCLLLYYTARPKIIIENMDGNHGVEYTHVTPMTSLLFPSAEYIRDRIMKYDEEFGNNHKTIVVDCTKVTKTDFTAAKCLGALVGDLSKVGKVVIFLKPKPSFAKMLAKTSGKKCCFANAEEAIIDIIKGQMPGPPRKSSLPHNGIDVDKFSIAEPKM